MAEYFYFKVLCPETEKTYRRIMRLFLRYCEKHEDNLSKPNEVTQRQVLRWRRNELNKQNVQERTWNTKTRHMQSLYNFWMKKKPVLVTENSFSEMQVEPGQKKKKVYTITDQDDLSDP